MYDPLPSKMNFICHLFDIDSDEKIGKEDMKFMLKTKINLRNKKKDESKKGDCKLTSEELIEIENDLRKTFKEDMKELSFKEFKQVIPKHIDINDIIKFFHIIPLPKEEYETVVEAFKESKSTDRFYVLSNQWYRSWKLFIDKYVDNNELQKAEEDNSPIRRSLSSMHQAKLFPLERKKSRDSPGISGDPSTIEIEGYHDSIARPGKINNSELAGPYPGSLKNGLMVL